MLNFIFISLIDISIEVFLEAIISYWNGSVEA